MPYDSADAPRFVVDHTFFNEVFRDDYESAVRHFATELNDYFIFRKMLQSEKIVYTSEQVRDEIVKQSKTTGVIVPHYISVPKFPTVEGYETDLHVIMYMMAFTLSRTYDNTFLLTTTSHSRIESRVRARLGAEEISSKRYELIIPFTVMDPEAAWKAVKALDPLYKDTVELKAQFE